MRRPVVVIRASTPRSKAPVLYTENCFVKFEDDVKAREIKRLLEKYRFEGRRALGYARNAWFISAKEGIGLELFGVVAKFLREEAVELAHPELIRRLAYKSAFAPQWHLKKTTVGGKAVPHRRRRGSRPRGVPQRRQAGRPSRRHPGHQQSPPRLG